MKRWNRQVLIMFFVFLITILISAMCEKGFCAEEYKDINFEKLFRAMAMQESLCNRKAVGALGELGIFQIKCSTANDYGVKNCKSLVDSNKVSYKIAQLHFYRLYFKFNQDVLVTLDAYNRGEENVRTCPHRTIKNTWKRIHPYAFKVMDRYNKNNVCTNF